MKNQNWYVGTKEITHSSWGTFRILKVEITLLATEHVKFQGDWGTWSEFIVLDSNGSYCYLLPILIQLHIH